MKIGILEPKDFSKKALNTLSKIGNIESFEDTANIEKFIEDKNILFIRLKYYISKNILDKAGKLRYLCTPTTGLNHIDLSYAKQKGIKIISLKDEREFLSNIRATPEHAFGLVIALLRHYKESFLSLENNQWNRDKYWGHEIFENKVGIIGFGRVGKLLAKYSDNFGAKIFFYDKNTNIEGLYNANKVKSIEKLILESNIIILCVSYNKNNNRFFDKKYINLLKNKFFINISRGELLDEDYLLQKIEENFFKGIALDVISDETKEKNNLNKFLKLVENRNFILTPHISGASYHSIHKTEEFIACKLKEILEKESEK